MKEIKEHQQKKKLVEKEKNKQDKIDNITLASEYDVLAKLIAITSDRDITGDYILGFLDTEEEKTFIRENYINMIRIINLFRKLEATPIYYVWNKQKKDWEKDENNQPIKKTARELGKTEILESAKRIMKLYQGNSNMLMILNRNKEKNFLAKALTKYGMEQIKETPLESMYEEMKKGIKKENEKE